MNRLDHPLVGLRRRHSRRAIAGVGVLLLAILLQRYLPGRLFDTTSWLWLAPLWDGFSTLVILAVALSYPAALGYAVYNGGPLVAVSIAALPTLLGAAARGQVTPTVDLALATSAAAAACWIALARSGRARGTGTATTGAIGLGAALTVLAAVVVVRVVDAVGPHARPGALLAAAGLVLGVIVAVWTLGWIVRRGDRGGVTRSS